MAGGKNHGERIDSLEGQAATLTARLDLCSYQIEGLIEQYKKVSDSAQEHHTSITVHEQKLIVLGDLKSAVAELAAIRLDLVALKKDVESLAKWKEDLKSERSEGARRWWSFGPNLVSALIASVVSTGLFFLARWLNKP